MSIWKKTQIWRYAQKLTCMCYRLNIRKRVIKTEIYGRKLAKYVWPRLARFLEDTKKWIRSCKQNVKHLLFKRYVGKWKDKPQTRIKYFQTIDLIKDLIYNSILSDNTHQKRGNGCTKSLDTLPKKILHDKVLQRYSPC